MRYVMRIAEFSESSNLWTQIALLGSPRSTPLSVSVQQPISSVCDDACHCLICVRWIMGVWGASALSLLKYIEWASNFTYHSRLLRQTIAGLWLLISIVTWILAFIGLPFTCNSDVNTTSLGQVNRYGYVMLAYCDHSQSTCETIALRVCIRVYMLCVS